MNNLTLLSAATLAVQLLAFGGACHVAIISRKRGWWFLAAGIAAITARRSIDLTAEHGSYLVALHAAMVLTGITLVYRSHTEEVDELSELANRVPNMVIITDANGEPTFLNSRWIAYTGAGLESVKNRGWKCLIHRNQVDAVVAAWDHALATGSLFEMDVQLIGEDGGYRWFLCRAFPIRCKSGKVRKWYSSCTDIHERKEGTIWLERKAEEVMESRKTKQ